MEKISGIISPSARLKSTDLQNSPPVRPGAPDFGRPLGEVTLAQRKDLTTAQKANMLREQMIEDKKRHKEQQMVEDLTNRFFMNQIDQRAITPGETHMEIPIQIEEMEDQSGEASFDDLSQEEMKYMPKGYYLDRSA